MIMITNKIETKEDIKFFRKEIKGILKSILANVEDNLDGHMAIVMGNENNEHICHLSDVHSANEPNTIKMSGFMYYNKFKLNKHTTDIQLMKVVDRIIGEYNISIVYHIY